MYRIHEIKLKLNQDIKMIPDMVRRRTGERELVMKNITIARESIDARDKSNIRRVYTVDFDSNISLNLPEAPDMTYHHPVEQAELKSRPVIVGFGPAGMFAALILAEMGARPIVLERGRKVSERAADVSRFWNEGKLNTESNVQFGEGGAGTFSDGKLTTGIKDIRIRKVLDEFVLAGADKEILYKQKPHIGTDKLVEIVSNIRKKIESLGGEVRFESRLTEIKTGDSPAGKRVTGIVINEDEFIETDHLCLAIGHSARDTFKMLFEMGLDMSQKPFSIGVRIQHPQAMINAAQYGDPAVAKILGPADYKLSHHCENGRGVYTFCMCPGGQVIAASSEEGMLVTNGMSNSARDGQYANSGLLVDVRTDDFGSDDILAGVEFQRRYERAAYEIGGSYSLPRTAFSEFTYSDVARCLPDFAVSSINEAMPFMGRRLRGFNSPDAMLFAVETRSSSPVRFFRDEHFMSNIKGLFPAGEGAGYAGGIMSAAVDGIKVAEAISLQGPRS